MNENTYGNQNSYPIPPGRFSASAPTPPPAIDFGRNYHPPNNSRMYNGGNYQQQLYNNQQLHYPTVGYLQGVSSNSGPPSRSSGSVISSDLNTHHGLRVLPSHKKILEPNNTFPPPPPHSYHPPSPERQSRTVIENHTDAGRPEMYHSIENSNPEEVATDAGREQFNHRHSRPNSRMRADGSFPLSVYQEQGANEDGSCSPSRSKPSLAPKPSPYSSTPSDGHLRTDNVNSTQANNLHRSQNSGDKNAEGKARSCDSGLPNDDMDSEGADSHRPLLSVNSGNLIKPIAKQSLKVSSSVTGS